MAINLSSTLKGIVLLYQQVFLCLCVCGGGGGGEVNISCQFINYISLREVKM